LAEVRLFAGVFGRAAGVRFAFAAAVERVVAVVVFFADVAVFRLAAVFRFAGGDDFARAVVVFLAEDRPLAPVLFFAVERRADEALEPRAEDFFAVDLPAVDFLAVDRLAVAFFAVDFLAVDLLAAGFFVADFLAVDLLAAGFRAEDLFAPPDDFFAPLPDLDAVAFLVVAIKKVPPNCVCYLTAQSAKFVPIELCTEMGHGRGKFLR
jgi:hypothetical protein